MVGIEYERRRWQGRSEHVEEFPGSQAEHPDLQYCYL